jgi:hypothetical protein
LKLGKVFFLTNRYNVMSQSLKISSLQTLSNATESETLHSWVYVEAEDGEAFFLEATSGMQEVEAG